MWTWTIIYLVLLVVNIFGAFSEKNTNKEFNKIIAILMGLFGIIHILYNGFVPL